MNLVLTLRDSFPFFVLCSSLLLVILPHLLDFFLRVCYKTWWRHRDRRPLRVPSLCQRRTGLPPPDQGIIHPRLRATVAHHPERPIVSPPPWSGISCALSWILDRLIRRNLGTSPSPAVSLFSRSMLRHPLRWLQPGHRLPFYPLVMPWMLRGVSVRWPLPTQPGRMLAFDSIYTDQEVTRGRCAVSRRLWEIAGQWWRRMVFLPWMSRPWRVQILWNNWLK